MKLSNKVSQLTEIIEPAVAACGVTLWGIEFAPQGRRSLLRIYIEVLPEARAAGEHITIEDCAAVTHQVSGVLEVHDPIAGEYVLEVSSPGLDRPFFSAAQLHEYVGERIHVRLIQPIGTGEQKRRKLTGRLEDMTDTSMNVLLDEGVTLEVKLDNIDQANLIYQDK